ncbi:MAG: hypothetical protein LIP01_13770 [Tannerellaceae bacterium]|nr:hypothetical protein [Tannerellaceae bacterium]
MLLGKNDISCHMYNTLKESIHGFSRNVFQFFGGSVLLAFLFCSYHNFFSVLSFMERGMAEYVDVYRYHYPYPVLLLPGLPAV